MIKFENVSKKYEKKDKFALKDVNININRGDFVFLVGSSGAGKSTFIKLLLREEVPSEGTLVVNEKDVASLSPRTIPKFRRNMGVVFQDFRLLPNKTVYENIAFAMEITQQKKRDIRRKVPVALSLVGLSDKAKSYPNQLSGGEQQRVGIARAIINNPVILIADEPTGNLDPQNADEIMEILQDINRRGTTVIIATHAKEIVDKLQKRVITLDKGLVTSDVQRGNYTNVKQCYL
ncbi:cell division ATP-binding protein FtsE [Proteocatella sphenisci]|uniref:cell division ATP-binding protein FtsE n=1 Tax=Proteocatella sphenisci TaxID=181070 RepID=UPI00048FB273|nr:cell division ATP-binding protein FtsE [Proteocatella sphenisci]